MDSTVPTPAIDQLSTIEFKIGIRGFNVSDVDNYLDEVAHDVEALRKGHSEQIAQLTQQLQRAAARIKQLESGAAPAPTAPSPSTPTPAVTVASSPNAADGVENATSLIAMAQEFVEKTKSTAVSESQQLLAKAKEEARRLLEEAKSRALDEVTQLEGRRKRLEEEITQLDRYVTTERERFRSLAGTLVEWFDSSFSLRQTSAPAPVATPPTVPAATPTPAPVAPSTPTPTVPPTTGGVTTIGQALNFGDENE
jgi:DivIVA domain-containing protein